MTAEPASPTGCARPSEPSRETRSAQRDPDARSVQANGRLSRHSATGPGSCSPSLRPPGANDRSRARARPSVHLRHLAGTPSRSTRRRSASTSQPSMRRRSPRSAPIIAPVSGSTVLCPPTVSESGNARRYPVASSPSNRGGPPQSWSVLMGGTLGARILENDLRLLETEPNLRSWRLRTRIDRQGARLTDR
jgi:hypothetical protein